MKTENNGNRQLAGWKFWTWPKQIRDLKAKLKTAQEVIERQRVDLEHHAKHAIRQRGLHRSQM